MLQKLGYLCYDMKLMKKISVVALKGGVGKTSVVAGLAKTLTGAAYKVGLLDIDITGSNLYSALGLAHSPKFLLDSAHEKVVVPEVEGFWLLSTASYAGEEFAVLWEGSTHKELSGALDRITMLKDMVDKLTKEPQRIEQELSEISREIDDILASSKWRYVSELLSDEIVTWPVALDYLIVDLPPSTSNEMFSFFEQVGDLFGVFIVSQPTKISTIGLQRTIDLLRQKQIPIIGLVANQDGFLNQHGEVEYQFLSPRVDLEVEAKRAGIPFLVSIPQSGDPAKLKPYFQQLADKVISSKPVVLKEITIGRKFKRALVKGIARRL